MCIHESNNSLPVYIIPTYPTTPPSLSRYDLSSSSGDSSPELSPINKRTSYRPSSASNSTGRSKKPPLDASPDYNSSEEYDGSLGRYTYLDSEVQLSSKHSYCDYSI